MILYILSPLQALLLLGVQRSSPEKNRVQPTPAQWGLKISAGCTYINLENTVHVMYWIGVDGHI